MSQYLIRKLLEVLHERGDKPEDKEEADWLGGLLAPHAGSRYLFFTQKNGERIFEIFDRAVELDPDLLNWKVPERETVAQEPQTKTVSKEEPDTKMMEFMKDYDEEPEPELEPHEVENYNWMMYQTFLLEPPEATVSFEDFVEITNEVREQKRKEMAKKRRTSGQANAGNNETQKDE